MKSYKNIVFVLVTVFTILIQLTNPMLAYADDATPPPPAESGTEVAPPEEPVETSAEEPSAEEPLMEEIPAEEPLTEAPPAELPAATEEPVEIEVTSQPEVDSVPVDDSNASTEPVAAEEPTVSEIIEQIPAETDIVVLDETGAALPLAMQEAADIIINSAPMWCPANATTIIVDCVYAETVALLLPLLSSKDEDGIIYFYTPTGTPYNTDDVTFDGTNTDIDQLADNRLTLQGGWDGTTGLGTTINISGSSNFSVPISITNWTGSVTVNNITVEGATGTGITVDTTGDIELDNVSVSNSTQGLNIQNGNNVTLDNVIISGGYTIVPKDPNAPFDPGDPFGLNSNINNPDGGVGSTISNISGDLHINNSEFNNSAYNPGDYYNTGIGLNISDAQNIYISDSDFTGNYNGGLWIQDSGEIDIKNSHFDKNVSGEGLRVVKGGDISISDSTFSENWSGIMRYGSGDITIDGSTFEKNLAVGLDVESNYDYEGLSLADSDGNITITNSVFSESGNNAAISTTGNVDISNSSFNSGNQNGAVIQGSTINLDHVTASNNSYYGLLLHSSGNIMMDHITAENNGTAGVILFTPGDASITNSTVINNGDFGVDASSVCRNFSFDKATENHDGWSYNPAVPGNYSYNYTYKDPISGKYITIKKEIHCNPKVYIDGKLIGGDKTKITMVETSGSQIEFDLSCEERDNFFATLPNGDQIQIFCPVSGKAIIKRLDNTMLPADLPAGYTYASAFSLKIIQDQTSIPVISEGGNVKASFNVPTMEAGANYSILYWDNGTWIPLKEFMLDENGNPRSFDLHPDDPRSILSGLNFVLTGDSPHAEVSTNFPGIFVLAQH